MSGMRTILAAALCAWAMPVALAAQSRAARPGDAAAQAARAQVERTMAAFAALDTEGFAAGLADDVTGFEMDLEGRPVRLGTRADAVRFAAETFAAIRAMHGTLALDVHAAECHAAGALAWCTVEFDARVTVPDGAAVTQPTRNTIVLREAGDGWKWAHWHSSLAAAPPSPAR